MPLYGIPGERIAYEVTAGPDGAPPIVLIHGFTASRASFLSNIPGLAHRFTVVSVELLGHGESDAPAEPAAYAPGAAVARIEGLLDQLGYEKVLLCGHSLGAALALRFALDHPERLAGLVVLNSNSAAGSPEWRESVRPGMHSMAASIREHGTAFMKQTRLYPGHSKRLPVDARAALVADFERAHPEGFAGTAEALVVDVNSWERLPQLTVQTLVIVGDRDQDFVKNAPAFVERLPAQLVDTFTIEGAGHAANLERPALFDAAVIGFAESIGYITIPTFEPPAHTSHAGGRALSAVGGAMVLGGVSLLVTAVMIGRQGSGTISAQPEPEATATARQSTPIDTVSGVRTPGPEKTPTTAPAAVASTTKASSTPTLAATAAPPTPVPPTRVPTTARGAEPPPPTPTPTATATPSATTTPTGPYAAISGPSSVAPGQVATFTDTSEPAHVRSDWAYLGQTKNHQSYVTITFPATPGCYPVTLTVYFTSPAATKTTTKSVAVGSATCP